MSEAVFGCLPLGKVVLLASCRQGLAVCRTAPNHCGQRRYPETPVVLEKACRQMPLKLGLSVREDTVLGPSNPRGCK